MRPERDGGKTEGMIDTSDTRLDANRELGRRFFAEQDRLRAGPSPELCAPGYVARIGASPAMDRTAHDAFARAFYAAFPDLAHVIESAIAEERVVAVRFVLRGTQTGAFFGVPATGRAIRVAAHAILHVDGGRVTELVAVLDEASLLRQLGVILP
jgi:steroid delta-isomerase-like uncharacterized protein